MNKALEELLLDLYFAGEASTRCCGRAEEVAATKERDALMEKIATFVLPEAGTSQNLRAVWAMSMLEGLWAEYTGGHLGGSAFNDMVCDLITTYVADSFNRTEPQRDGS